MLVKDKIPASPSDDLIESCATELITVLCRTHSELEEIMQILMNKKDALRCLKIILHGMNRILSDDCQPLGDTVEDYIQQIVEGLSSPDTGLQSCICVIISSFVLISEQEDGMQKVINSGVVHRLIQLIGTNDVSLLKPTLLLFSVLLSGNIDQRNIVLESGIVSHLNYIVKHTDDSNVILHAVTAISEIATEKHHIEALINTRILPEVIKHLANTNKMIKLQAARAVTNIIKYGTIQQIVYLCKRNILRPYCDLLTLKDADILLRTLNDLWKILLAARKLNQEERMVYMIEECDGWEKIMLLQDHKEQRVREYWVKFMNAFHQHDWVARWILQ